MTNQAQNKSNSQKVRRLRYNDQIIDGSKNTLNGPFYDGDIFEILKETAKMFRIKNLKSGELHTIYKNSHFFTEI